MITCSVGPAFSSLPSLTSLLLLPSFLRSLRYLDDFRLSCAAWALPFYFFMVVTVPCSALAVFAGPRFWVTSNLLEVIAAKYKDSDAATARHSDSETYSESGMYNNICIGMLYCTVI